MPPACSESVAGSASAIDSLGPTISPSAAGSASHPAASSTMDGVLARIASHTSASSLSSVMKACLSVHASAAFALVNVELGRAPPSERALSLSSMSRK